jgi:predicted GNAT family acetyltransferase
MTAVAILASGAVAQNEAELLSTIKDVKMLKKLAVKSVAVLGVLVSGKKLINVAENYVNEQFGNFEGEGVKKKMTKKQMKQMQGEGFFQ